MTTQTDELLSFYAAEFERETGCKWEARAHQIRGLGSRADVVWDPAHACGIRLEHCPKALEGGLPGIYADADEIADFSAEPIGIAEWHRRVVEMRK